MDLHLVTIIILGIFSLFFLCCAWAIVEEGIRKSREAKRWKDWFDRKREE